MRTFPTSLSILFAAAATATAQTTPNLIALTLNTPLIHQSVHGTCTALNQCTPLGLPLPTIVPFPFWAGGTAWDSANSAVWATTGQWLGRYGMNGCSLQCGPLPCPKSSAVAEATGLDMHDGQNRLWVIDSAGWITECSNTCPPAVINSYNTGLPLTGNVVTSAISIDELRGLVFYSTCDFGAGSGRIYVAPLATPGAWFQWTPIFDCLPLPTLITGLAVDAANSAIYWTNGRGTFRWTYTYNPSGPSVAFTPGTCCMQLAPLPDPYTDLSIRWGGATSMGVPCANGACPPCPMVHSLRNAPLLGTTLQLGLDQASPTSLALCAVDFGACGVGPTVAPFCGPILVPLTAAMLLLGPNIPIGGSPCNGSTTFLLPLPANPIFVGTPLASMCVALCSPSGTMMSNCLSFVLQ
ncbi:MAG TPA: hypothetical protein VFD82_22145 [Planctomycetota bacterium]|nr:hypothetical protein [Planctomycetota bacterium]